MIEAVPELVKESQQEVQEELQQVAMVEASNIVQSMVEEGQEVPPEIQTELQQMQRVPTHATEAVQIAAVVEETQASVIGEPQSQGQAQEEDTESTPSDFDPEHWTQGQVTSPKTIKEQRELAQKGVYLVVATPIGVSLDIFVTSLADPPLSLQEQKDIRKRGGQILYSLMEDAYDISRMEIDPSLFPHRRTSESPRGESSLSTPRTNVAVAQPRDTEIQEQETISDILEEISEVSSAKESAMGSP